MKPRVRTLKPLSRAPQDVTQVYHPRPKDAIQQDERQVMSLGTGSTEVGELDHHRSPMNNFGRGIALELGNAAAAPFALVAKGLDAASTKKGDPNVHRWEAPVAAQKIDMEEKFHPEGQMGRAGRMVGFVAGELPYYVYGGGEIEQGLKAAGEVSEVGSIWKRLNRAAEISESPYSDSMLRNPVADVVARATGSAAVAAPTAIALGTASTPMGENPIPNAALAAATWGAAGFAAEPVMEVGARGIARILNRIPKAQAKTGIRLGLAEVARHAAPLLHSLTPRLDDYLKYDIQDRVVDAWNHIGKLEAEEPDQDH